MKYTIILPAMLLTAVLLYGCYYDSEEALYPRLDSGCDTTNVTFAGSVVPILAASCYGCHSNANAPVFGENIRLEAYADVIANLDRLHGAITWQDGYTRMPKDAAQLDACAIRTIEIWIAQGAPQNAAPTGGVR